MKFGYLAFKGHESELLGEIQYHGFQKVIQMDRLFLMEANLSLAWSQLKLSNIEIIKIDSINQAARALKTEQKLWASYSFHLHRRTQLIQEKLIRVKKKKLHFLDKIPSEPFGFWCLLSENEILKSIHTSSALPLGEVEFEENKIIPPSRAYLKLWEVFTLHVAPPQAHQTVLDMGSCPGGWTWVLQSLGCQVLSVDKAPLAPQIAELPRISFFKGDAFKIKPQDIPKPDWFFSDIICEPQALLDMVLLWQRAYPQMKFICTIKYKGSTDYDVTNRFLQIPGSRIIHLYHNKHEVTWIKI